MRTRSLAAASCGFAAAALALVVPVLGASAIASYSHGSQFISELGASGTPHARLVAVAGFAPIGVLFLAFLLLASALFPASRRTTAGVFALSSVGVAYLVSAVFPCDAGCPSAGSFSQTVHNAFGLLEYVGAIAGLALLGAAFSHSPGWRSAAWACAICGVLVALGFLGMLIPAFAGFRGFSQRIAEAGIFSWVAYVSGFLLSRVPRATNDGWQA